MLTPSHLKIHLENGTTVLFLVQLNLFDRLFKLVNLVYKTINPRFSVSHDFFLSFEIPLLTFL
jgi:hypothetical protein